MDLKEIEFTLKLAYTKRDALKRDLKQGTLECGEYTDILQAHQSYAKILKTIEWLKKKRLEVGYNTL